MFLTSSKNSVLWLPQMYSAVLFLLKEDKCDPVWPVSLSASSD